MFNRNKGIDRIVHLKEEIVSTELKTGLIGRIISVQVFPRIEFDGDTIDYGAMVKYTGTLLGFVQERDNITIHMEGMEVIRYSKKTHLIEFYERLVNVSLG